MEGFEAGCRWRYIGSTETRCEVCEADARCETEETGMDWYRSRSYVSLNAARFTIVPGCDYSECQQFDKCIRTKDAWRSTEHERLHVTSHLTASPTEKYEALIRLLSTPTQHRKRTHFLRNDQATPSLTSQTPTFHAYLFQ